MRRRAGFLLTACFFLIGHGAAQVDTPQALNQRLVSAYQSKDYATFLILAQQMITMMPDDPRARYNVASAESLVGHPEEALRQLDFLLERHIDFGAEKDPDFDAMRKTPEWAAFEAHLAAMRHPVVKSTAAFVLPEKGLLASSIAVDSTTGDSYTGSARERKVIKRTKDGAVSEFATDKDGLFGVTSLLIDSARKQLFVGSSALAFMRDFRKGDEGKARVSVFDLTTGKLIRSALLAVAGERHVAGEMTEDSKGNLFLVDHGSSEIRRLRRSSSELELYISSVVFAAPAGLAMSADEHSLYVLDGASGLWAVDVLSTDRTHLATAETVWLGGMKGLLRVPRGFVSLQTGVTPATPERLVEIMLDAKSEKIVGVETLENNVEAYEAPALGSLAGGDLFYIADGQADLVDAKSGTVAVGKLKETVVLKLPLVQ